MYVYRVKRLTFSMDKPGRYLHAITSVLFNTFVPAFFPSKLRDHLDGMSHSHHSADLCMGPCFFDSCPSPISVRRSILAFGTSRPHKLKVKKGYFSSSTIYPTVKNAGFPVFGNVEWEKGRLDGHCV